ncbi:MAG: GNAT family N-acetyltransferase, partial [Anaerolineae bacterium]|nr:GNAT family N-acetyltransferase [Anaerolineae bacterium]
FLEVADEPVAAYVNFDYNNHIMVYNSGLNPDKATALSPGILLLAYTIQHAIEQGRDVFDYLRGDEQYKYRMGGKDTRVFNLKAVYRS